MSTQRRVARWQRFISTEQTGIAVSTSYDAGMASSMKQFRRVAVGLTASSFHFGFQFGTYELATNSLSSGNGCTWRFCLRAGLSAEQLPLISPLLSGGFQPRQERCGLTRAPKVFAGTKAEHEQSALPWVLTGVCPRTERQHGQGNLYLQHAARNAACDSGRRSARRDLLRA